MTEDFYDLLDIPRDASPEEIKEAYRTQVRVYHPDLNDDDRARAQFTALRKAYDILGDPVERQAYDRLGHEDYVAKRTKGLPSPDQWKSSRRVSGKPRASGGSSASTRDTIGTGSRTTADRGVGSTDGGTATRSARRSSRRYAHSRRGWLANNRAARWWRQRNVAWPLIWVSTIVYLAGLVHFGVANEASLRPLAAELRAAGTDLASLSSTLGAESHGVESVVGFVTTFELLAAPLGLDPTEWYLVLAAFVLGTILLLVVDRVLWRADTWGPVSIDETIFVALSLAIVSLLLGGPLLAGAILMPLLFGVIIHRTRQLPGWSPSYLHVALVSTPALALALGYAGYTSLSSDLVAFVVCPIAGSLGLVCRVNVRKRFDR